MIGLKPGIIGLTLNHGQWLLTELARPFSARTPPHFRFVMSIAITLPKRRSGGIICRTVKLLLWGNFDPKGIHQQ